MGAQLPPRFFVEEKQCEKLDKKVEKSQIGKIPDVFLVKREVYEPQNKSGNVFRAECLNRSAPSTVSPKVFCCGKCFFDSLDLGKSFTPPSPRSTVFAV